MKPLSLLFPALFVLLSIDASAQWLQSNGPYGGPVTSLAVSNTKLFAGTYGNGVYLSGDGGASWTPPNDESLENARIWTVTTAGNAVFAAGRGYVYHSTNDGATWSVFPIGLPSRLVTSLVSDDSGLFVGTYGSGVLRSLDGGASWTAVNNGMSALYVLVLVSRDTILFAGTEGTAYRSSDYGGNWTEIGAGLSPCWVHSLVFSDSNLFAATNKGVYVSTNKGDSWKARNTGLPAFVTVLSLAHCGGFLFAGTARDFAPARVYRTTDCGEHWVDASSGLPPDVDVTSLTFEDTTLFAGTMGCGVYRSTNYGLNWTAAKVGLPAPSVISFASDETTIYAGTDGGGIYVSADSGLNWRDANSGLTSIEVPSLVCTDGNLFAATAWGGVFRSTDRGQSWTEVNNGLPGNKNAASLLALGSRLFVGRVDASGGVFVSTNLGGSWMRASTGLPGLTDITGLLGDGNNLLATSKNGGIFRSTDLGAKWTAADSGLADRHVYSQAHHAGLLFVGTLSGGVSRSTNWGESWTAVNTGLPLAPVYALASDGKMLFAGLQNSGVYLSTDLGSSWIRFNTGLPSGADMRAFTRFGNRLFAGFKSQGVWMMAPGDTGSDPAGRVVFPPDHSSMADDLFVFRWHPYPGALLYHIQSSTDSLFQQGFLLNDSTVADTTHASLILAVDSTFIEPTGGTWYWRLRAYTARGWSDWSAPWSYEWLLTGVTEPGSGPSGFCLEQNYPNPFNPTTVVSSQLPVASEVRLVVYDILGREVAVLAKERRVRGTYHDTFDASELAGGVYFYRLTAGKFIQTKRMVLLR